VTRDKQAALIFMKKAMKRHSAPEKITTDGLRSYRVAMTELGKAGKPEVGRWTNNQVENSHLPFATRAGNAPAATDAPTQGLTAFTARGQFMRPVAVCQGMIPDEIDNLRVPAHRAAGLWSTGLAAEQ
jgi:transposase-like protein